MQSVTFQVPGKPQGKARTRTSYNEHLKRVISYTPDNDLLYENLIKTLYMQAADGSSMTVRERILEIARHGTNILTIPAFAGGTK